MGPIDFKMPIMLEKDKKAQGRGEGDEPSDKKAPLADVPLPRDIGKNQIVNDKAREDNEFPFKLLVHTERDFSPIKKEEKGNSQKRSFNRAMIKKLPSEALRNSKARRFRLRLSPPRWRRDRCNCRYSDNGNWRGNENKAI